MALVDMILFPAAVEGPTPLRPRVTQRLIPKTLYSTAVVASLRTGSRAYFLLILLVLGLVTRGALVPARADGAPVADPPFDLALLRSESLELACGAELFTVFGNADAAHDVPLVSFLNDTLGDANPANDQLRYVWVFSYCPPSLSQRILASVPFLYHRFSSRPMQRNANGPPPVIFDFSRPTDSIWRRIAWYALQATVLDPHGWVLQAGSRTYARNEHGHRTAHLQKGLSVLAAYREGGGRLGPLADDRDFERAYVRLVESGFAGAFLHEKSLTDVYARDMGATRLRIAHNWDLLRQRCEEEGLYFEPLPGAPARAEHAMVWVREDEVAASPRRRRFDKRFLNIASPWSDPALRAWKGYRRTSHVDRDGRVTGHPVEGSRPVTMIPLAIYGLDFPKIPALLVDFRSIFNAKRREMSRHALEDVGRYLLDATPIGDLQYYVARKVYSMVTGRTGQDMGQQSRARTYAQLKSLVVLRDLFEPELRELVVRDLERMNINPLENDADAERRLAVTQYQALRQQIAAGALDTRVERDRGVERTRLAHGRFGAALLHVATIASFGLYRHADDGPDVQERYARTRALRRHSLLLAEVASAPPPIEVTWDPARFREALHFVAREGADGDEALARTVQAIFKGSREAEVRALAVDALYRIDNAAAKRALYEIYTDESVALDLRRHSGRLLRQAIDESQHVHGRDASAFGRGITLDY